MNHPRLYTCICFFIFYISNCISLLAINNDRILNAWSIDNYCDSISASYDTIWHQFHQFNPIFNYSISNTYLGSIGTAVVPNDFFMRRTQNFLFITPYIPYMHTLYNTKFYNTKRRFTEFKYSSSNGAKNKLEETLNVFHTQNINPGFNVGIDYDMIADKGQYQTNWTEKGDYKAKVNAITVFSSYQNNNYRLFASYNYNHIGPNTEFGGVSNDTLITDTTLATDKITGLLKNAVSNLRNRNAYLCHEYNFIDLVRNSDSSGYNSLNYLAIGHSFKYDDNFHTYKDQTDTARFEYKNIFIDSNLTYDSTHFRSLVNTLYLKMNSKLAGKYNIEICTDFTYELVKYGNNIPTQIIPYPHPDKKINTDNILIIWHNNDTIFKNYSFTDTTRNCSFGGRFKLYNNERITVYFDPKYYVSGYKKNNYQVYAGMINKILLFNKPVFLVLSTSLTNESPDYYLRNFSSNHHTWHNQLNKSEKRNFVSFSVCDSSNTLSVNGSAAKITNYIYLDSTMMPDNYPSFNVLSLRMHYNFHLWKFYFLNRFLLQYTNAERQVLDLPKYSFYNTTYFQFDVVKDVMAAEIGFDLQYNTRFYIMAFDPATGLFYSQKDIMIGNYPYVDIFIDAKWKRTRLFAKYEHVDSGLPKIRKDNFTALHYPRNAAMLKVGIAWTFYD